MALPFVLFLNVPIDGEDWSKREHTAGHWCVGIFESDVRNEEFADCGITATRAFETLDEAVAYIQSHLTNQTVPFEFEEHIARASGDMCGARIVSVDGGMPECAREAGHSGNHMAFDHVRDGEVVDDPFFTEWPSSESVR